MFTKALMAGSLLAAMTIDARADMQLPNRATPAAWRGGYRYRRYSTPNRSYSYNRNSSGRSSPLDYPAYMQPFATRRNQWNRYPNQPFYLRGERKSLLILP